MYSILETSAAQPAAENQPAAPLPEPPKAPKSISETRVLGGKLCLAGVGNRNADLMFIATTVQDEEAMETMHTNSEIGSTIKSKAMFMKGPIGVQFRDLIMGVGIDPQDTYYTALCRWLMPKQHRNKPKKEDIAWGEEMLYNEIKEVQPKIIVCIGKPVFDLLSDVKLKQTDIEGGFFRCSKFDCILYFIPDLWQLRAKPEKYERYRIDMMQVRRMYDDVRGITVNRVAEHYRTISTKAELKGLVAEWKASNFGLFSVDCEWGGMQVVDCQLRSVQFCWAPGHAVYLRFMDENRNYTFDCSYEEAGAILAEHLDKPEVKYIGHHLSVDLTAIAYWLKLSWYQKGFFDTEFAEQTADEYASLGLDNIAMKYTDKGRYDIELVMWKKANKLDPDLGYGTIPDSILIPYACRDVDVVFQAMPFIIQKLVQQDLWEYYQTVFNPFVTDVFTNFSLVGLPMDLPKMDHLRELFSFARDAMNVKFVETIQAEARNIMLGKFNQLFGEDVGPLMMGRLVQLVEHEETRDHAAAFDFLKTVVGTSRLMEFEPFLNHYIESPRFNIRAAPSMRRWLFTIKGFIPVKSTNNKEKGMPSTAWERVLTYPADKQKEFTPSTDKQTLQILAASTGDAVLNQLLELNAVGNLCKAFLKEPDIDEETGEVTRENGLHFWLASDGRVHGQMSTTETGRPRSWKPNSLNWPSYVNERILDGIRKVFAILQKEGLLPREYLGYSLADGEAGYVKIPSIRSVVKAPPGYILVESDYQTAEIRGLAFVSQDEAMINLVTKPDLNFAVWKENKKVTVRLSFDPRSQIAPQHQDPELLMSVVGKDKVRRKITEDDLLRNKDGTLVHPKNDLHWSLAEMVHNKPREVLNDKKDRGAAKVGNFSSAYGATAMTLERKIEADTGIKPEPGTGQRLLEALAMRQPDADAFLKFVETVPKYPGLMIAASGRRRRFIGHPDHIQGFTSRERDGVFNTAGREARNYYLQESVAATAAIAGRDILDLAIKHGLEGRPITILYDSVVTLCPLHERFIFSKAHTLFMYLKVGWLYGKRVLRYPIDTELNPAWSTPDYSILPTLENPDYHPTPEHLKPLENWLDEMIAYYTENEMASVLNRKEFTAPSPTPWKHAMM